LGAKKDGTQMCRHLHAVLIFALLRIVGSYPTPQNPIVKEPLLRLQSTTANIESKMKIQPKNSLFTDV
jgi:hypothetical protein